MISRFFALLLFLSVLSCSTGIGQSGSAAPLYEGRPLDRSRLLQTVAIGSCNRQDLPQEMWSYILQNDPDLWIWLGDNIYADTEDMNKMEGMYRKQKSAPEYRRLLEQTSVIGTWDDHDYGVNDGDRTYPKRVESKDLLLDFLDVPKNDPVRSREGAYQSYTFGPEGQQVKIILLDTRYFRDELQDNPSRETRYLPNPVGDMLGEAQWKWLERELTESTANVHIIASGVQFIAEEQRFEKWANFPKARQRFFDLMAKTRPANALLISGDRHVAELSRIELEGLGYPLYELTASGLTHTWSQIFDESNRYRVGDLVVAKNFGLIRIDWSGSQPVVTVEVKGLENELFLEYTVRQ